MTTTLYVIHLVGEDRAMYRNDRDHRYLLHNSKAHALRVIRWLGLTNVKVREATEEEEAAGHIETLKA